METKEKNKNPKINFKELDNNTILVTSTNKGQEYLIEVVGFTDENIIEIKKIKEEMSELLEEEEA